MVYEPNWESIDSRPVPKWFDDAKFGIFIHWGVYSVPAWAPKGTYAEWYWASMANKEGHTWKFHVQNYGEKFKYQDFAPMFKAEMFDPEEWADIFKRSGAQYIVPTSKHHDGFCLWPSVHSWNWNSMDIGPHRDLIGDLTKAVCDKGIKMGFYYSLYEWYNPLYLSDPSLYAVKHMIPQLKDAVERYQPSIIFTDGEWDQPSDIWHSFDFLTWLFNESSCRENVVVNDRWGKETRNEHGGYYTTEYGQVGGGKNLVEQHKWEECRGIGGSFGYNRNESIFDYAKSRDLIHLLINIVSNGGNLLLNIGPTADGRIPVIMQERLIDIGEWLNTNGEAIYGAHPWQNHQKDDSVRYTCKDDTVYAICLSLPKHELVVKVPEQRTDISISLLGSDAKLSWKYVDDNLHVEILSRLTDEHAHVFKIKGLK